MTDGSLQRGDDPNSREETRGVYWTIFERQSENKSRLRCHPSGFVNSPDSRTGWSSGRSHCSATQFRYDSWSCGKPASCVDSWWCGCRNFTFCPHTKHRVNSAAISQSIEPTPYNIFSDDSSDRISLFVWRSREVLGS